MKAIEVFASLEQIFPEIRRGFGKTTYSRTSSEFPILQTSKYGASTKSGSFDWKEEAMDLGDDEEVKTISIKSEW